MEQAAISKVPRKLSACETYIALIKGYSVLALLVTPRAFANGGYIFVAAIEIFSAILTTYCIMKLVDVGLYYDSFSYSSVVQKAFGKRIRFVLDLMIGAT